MTKGNAIRYYRKFSAADSYILGFVYKRNLYWIEVDEIMPRYMKMGQSAKSKGGSQKLSLYLNNKSKQELIRKGAQCIGTEERLNEGVGNKGERFESLVYTLYGLEPRARNNVSFWRCGDIRVNDREIQIKFEKAQIVEITTLHNLQACGQAFRSYTPKRKKKEKEEEK